MLLALPEEVEGRPEVVQREGRWQSSLSPPLSLLLLLVLLVLSDCRYLQPTELLLQAVLAQVEEVRQREHLCRGKVVAEAKAVQVGVAGGDHLEANKTKIKRL